ncbi:MAG: transglycosylase SLT domain-containing protein [Alphaproteobacteria bacterium]
MAAAARPHTKITRRLLLCTLLLAIAVLGIDSSAAFAADRTRPEAKTALVFPHIGNIPRAADLPRVLSAEDRILYRQLFALEARGSHAKAARLMDGLADPILVGDVLAARYLSAGYVTSYAELADWLERYGDYPDAGKLYRLALSKKPKGAAAPAKPPILYAEAGKKRRSVAPAQIVCNGGKQDAKLVVSARKELSAGDEADAMAFAGKAATDGDCPEAQWIAGLAAFRLGDDAAARRHFESLAESADAPDALVAAGAYWAARVHLRAGRPQLVTHWLGAAAEHSRSFYGLIAQRALGMTLRPIWESDALTVADLDAIGNLPRLRHAIALHEAGQAERAEPVVKSVVSRATPELQKALLPLIQALKLPELEVALAKRAASVDGRRHDAASYPMPDWRPVNGRPFDRALVFALIRSESGFQSRARNPSGARGVMQMMPATAKFVARKAGVKGFKTALLNEPEVSIALGQSYIEHLAEAPEVKGGLFRLIAAYNAGPGALGRWQESLDHDDPLLFIETLPSRETRDLIQRVAADYWIYKMRLGEPTPSLDDVAANRWPRYEGRRGPSMAGNG